MGHYVVCLPQLRPQQQRAPDHDPRQGRTIAWNSALYSQWDSLALCWEHMEVMAKHYTVNKNKTGSSQAAKSDCGSDHELLIAKFRCKLKKVGKTTRPFRHDLNHIPYDYTVEVTNRFKGLDLIDRVPEVIKTIHPKKEMQKSKMVV